MAAEPLLSVRGLEKRYGGILASNAIDLKVERSEIRAVIGPNGAGKTTFIGQISGEVQPDAGQIMFDGRDITRQSIESRARLGLARSYQLTSIMPSLTVLENALAGALAHADRPLRHWRGYRADEPASQMARAAIEQVGLTERLSDPAHLLSHGERRQLEIAIALATAPRMLLLDEPTAGMGPDEAQRIVDLLRTLRDRYAILLVEHDMNFVFAVCDRITVLNTGTVIADGTPEEVRRSAAVRKAYLGEDGGNKNTKAG